MRDRFMGGPPMPFARQFDRPFGRGPRAARGNVRGAILVLLGEGPMHGYQIMQELETRSSGMWKPSPGSVYPTLQALEDEGLVKAEESDGRRVFRLTATGQAHVDEHRAEIGTPWEDFAERGAHAELRSLIGAVLGALRQVAAAGTPAQVEQAKKLLSDTRRGLYRILAAEEE